MLEADHLDQMAVIICRFVGGDTHLLTPEDHELIDLVLIHAEDVLREDDGSYTLSEQSYEDDDPEDEEWDWDSLHDSDYLEDD